MWDEGEMREKTRLPALNSIRSFIWVPPSCKRTQNLFTECSMHVTITYGFIMADSICLWIFYLCTEVILHKIIMNWYKLLLINMNYVLFSEQENSEIQMYSIDYYFFNSKVLHFVPIACSWWNLCGTWDYLSQLCFRDWFFQWKNLVHLYS